MKSLLDYDARSNVLLRLERLHAGSARQWGTMNAHEMICHVADQLGVAMGEIKSRRRGNLLTRTLFKWYVLNVMKEIPRGRVKTVSEMRFTEPAKWGDDSTRLRNAIDRFPRCSEFASHPVFGPMTPDQWGVLAYSHIDHHFKQFGV